MRYILSVSSRAVPGREDEYDAWYEDVHAPEVTALPGFLSYERFRQIDMEGKETGEFIAHYFRPECGDIILNPFDARCVYWSPFAEIAHPADADRIAQQLVTETSDKDKDVWLETSRILVANMIRELWREERCTLLDLHAALKTLGKEELKTWLKDTSSARTFSDDADRATGSVLFMLA